MAGLDVTGDRRAVLIAGPTASGKSALALDLASRHGGVVINADSMQVYRELRILTARPSEADEAIAPHRLYGEVPAAERYSVARWRDDASLALEAAWAEGRLPVVVGGTGLYFKALTEGLAAMPPVPDDVRQEIEARAASEGIPALHAALAALDPETADRLERNDRTRVMRALEVITATGRSIGVWQSEAGAPPLIDPAETRRIVLDPDRAALYQRIARRFDAMIEAGAVDEVRALLALDLDPSLPAMKAIGVREFADAIHGRLAMDDAVDRARRETRRYAKRQITWFRNQMADWERLSPGGP